MLTPSLTRPLVMAVFIADTYSLALHWIYDHDLLDREPVDPDQLHAPLSHWHGNKKAGDLTHYGDQAWHLYQFLQQHNQFNAVAYRNSWAHFMRHYTGYIDKASAMTLQNISQGIEPAGSESTELSVTGRVVCLLPFVSNKHAFLEQAQALAAITHNSPSTLATTEYLARVLLDCLGGIPAEEALERELHCLPPALQQLVAMGRDSAADDTRQALRRFGIACDLQHGLPGVAHLLCRYRSVPEMLQQNALAGGDSSARAMITAAIMTAQAESPELPQHWLPLCWPETAI
jgi:ADP-ribosylglycohydrolase